ncbi:MAG: endolytic transglycosylase MltG [Actinomycetes bacterium]|jgi:UPF0755 protein|nr:endolytic transglycosylase MltG [Actinomycetes bacterium]
MMRMRSQKRSSVGLVFLTVLVLVALVGIVGGWWLLFSKNGVPTSDSPVAVTIESGSSTRQVAETLQAAGLIDNPLVFRVRVRFANADAQIKAGDFEITPGTDYDDIIELLKTGPARQSVRVVIPEGKTIAQTAAILAEKLPIQADDFTTIARSAAPDYVDRFEFLAGAYQDSLEGFLFPDTYDFDVDATADQVITTMLSRFRDVWASLDAPSATTKGYTTTEIVTIASLVEREVSVDDERVLVSSVIQNRLKKGMRLQLCSSVQFLLPGEEKSKLRLTNADLATESPYNTYLHQGLPPGPIANPGRAALDAALHPAKTDYIYFVLTGKDGSQTFCSTLAQFEKAKAKSKAVFGE